MARRDFTINAMAHPARRRRPARPFGGVADLERRELRTVAPTSFEEDPLRMRARAALRLAARLRPDAGDAGADADERAAASPTSPAERIGGGIKADGLGELSKLLLGREPARALRLARDTGVLAAIIPEFAPAIGYALDSRPAAATARRAHLRASSRTPRDAGASLEVRLACLLHDLGKPAATGRKRSCGRRAPDRGSHPEAAPLSDSAPASRRPHRRGPRVPHSTARRRARRAAVPRPARRRARVRPDRPQARRPGREARVPATSSRRSRSSARRSCGSGHSRTGSPTSRSAATTSGRSGSPRARSSGGVLHALLDDVVDDPARNDRAWLLERAGAELP